MSTHANRLAALAVGAAVFFAPAVLEARAAAPAGEGQVTTLRVPDGGIQPQVAVDRKGTVHLVYFTGDPKAGRLFYARSEANGKFSEPVPVNHRPNAIAVGNIRGAHLALGKNGRVHVAWFGVGDADGAGKSGKETPLLYTRMAEDGKGFEPERNVITKAFGLDGGGSVAADDGGTVYVAWHAGGPDGHGEANRRVWVARSEDEGRTFTAETPAFKEPTGACGCCGLKAYVDGNGTLYVAYRSATEKVNRDTYLLVSRDKGRSFTGEDVHGWTVGVCPMSSYALAEGDGGVRLAWETAGQVYLAHVDEKTGKPSGKLTPPGAGKGQKHPAVAVNARGETILAWTEGTSWGRGGAVAWQVFDKEGRPTAVQGRAEGVPAWSLVAVFAKPDGGFTVVY
ncbi:MAG: glycoside hydrolase [Gemmataceae bacterium]|nr:glycoside hydrolase [Gemmataceae bacterium]